ncbi:MAG TPA: triphosphoribosyl-dephospho-CoA synthase [Pirellulales bacterium]|jgi:triphosphoribosyl-dephospho-CoA synthase|nr:triphosphoribosyl-dephospho-CoA synthase [Pirellulales bacterium]
MNHEPPLSIGQCASLACLLEATAPKPGNVHRGADFDDLTYLDFAVAAVAMAPAFEDAAAGAGVGQTVLAAVRAMRRAVAGNTSLGTILLLAPLACVPRGEPLATGVKQTLARLSPADSRQVYDAIRLAAPGGLGEVAEADVAGEPPDDLLFAMQLAAERDLVARQYANSFEQVLQAIVPWLSEGLERQWPLADAIVRTQLQLLRDFPDSLIARKCGRDIALQAAARAGKTLEAGLPGDEDYHRAIADFDFWLRSDDHRRNPGTSADLLAAGLFAALRDGIIELPVKFY